MRVYYVYSTQYQEVFMNMKNSKSYTKVYKGWVLLGSILFVASALIGCKDPSNSGGGENSSQYTAVAYGNLAGYLASASSTEVNYIEITGSIPVADLKGCLNPMTSEFEMGALATKLQTPPGKKIALKLPETVTGITSMTYCFKDCTNLVSLMNIPSSVTDMNGCFSGCAELTDVSAIPSGVTDLQDCFSGCIKLVSAPAVPESVTAMAWCFKGCTNLTKVPTVPQNVTAIKECFEGCIKLSSVTLKCNYNPALMGPDPSFYHAFNNCPALGAGSITVPQGKLGDYTAAAGTMGTTADKFKEAD